MVSVNTMEAHELIKLLQDPTKKATKDYIIIDVRDEDHEGPHIKSSINVPSESFNQEFPSLKQKYPDCSMWIFHWYLMLF